MKRVCVYSGSNLGTRPEYKRLAVQLGDVFIQQNIELVYGGSRIGLMGELANHILERGGSVTGVMPANLFPKELVHTKLSNLIEVNSMHERKQTMADLADGFIALPGGVGTYEELFEVLSWSQLGIHHKPIGLLNAEDFFEPLLSLIQHTILEGFMHNSNVKLLLVASEPAKLLNLMSQYTPPILHTKWRELNRA